MTALGLGLVVATAVITGVVVANWSGRDVERKGEPPKRDSALGSDTQGAPRRTRARCPAAFLASQATIAGCHQQAAAQSSQRSNTTEIVRGGALAVNPNVSGRFPMLRRSLESLFDRTGAR